MFHPRSLESCLRSKDSRAVWRGAVGKGPQGTSLAAYPTASPVLNGGDEETYRKVTRLVATQLSGNPPGSAGALAALHTRACCSGGARARTGSGTEHGKLADQRSTRLAQHQAQDRQHGAHV